MKKLLIAFFLSSLILSCEKTSPNTNDDIQEEQDTYFIRYISDRAIGIISYTTEDGGGQSLTTNSYTEFERTIGPVYTGFSCSFTVDRGTGVRDIPVRIEVKKNEEPFVVKVEGNRVTIAIFRTENPCVPGSIPGDTTLKIRELQKCGSLFLL